MFPHDQRGTVSTKLVTSDRWLTHIPENDTLSVELDPLKLRDKSVTNLRRTKIKYWVSERRSR